MKIKPHIVCTLHDPKGELIDRIARNQWLGWLLKCGASSVDLIATPITYESNYPKIRNIDDVGGRAMILEEHPGIYSAINIVQNSHMQALVMGVKRTQEDNGWIFYMDGDRLISDLENNRYSYYFLFKELQKKFNQREVDAISLIRDPHIESLSRRVTETPINLALYETIGVQTDPFSSYLAMRRDLVKTILNANEDYETFPVLEWELASIKVKAKLIGHRPEGIDSGMIGIYEDTLPLRGDSGGILALNTIDLDQLRVAKELDTASKPELTKRINIAITALDVIRFWLRNLNIDRSCIESIQCLYELDNFKYILASSHAH